MNSNPMISPVPKPAPGAQTTSPSGQAAAAAISVKPDAAGGAGEAKNTKTMNTRNALIDALANRCKDRAGKPEGAVENAGTSEGVKKGWEKRRQFYRGQGADNPRRPHSDAGGFAKREHLHVETEHGTFKSPSWWKGSKRHQRTAEQQVESVKHPSELVEKHGWKSFNCTARDVIADRKAALNSGTSEGAVKGWETRKVGGVALTKPVSVYMTRNPKPYMGRVVGKHPQYGEDVDFHDLQRKSSTHHTGEIKESGIYKLSKEAVVGSSRIDTGFVHVHDDGSIEEIQRDEVHKRIQSDSAKNSTMLAQFSPSPMIGSYAEGKRRAKNSGTSEGVKKSWAHRHAGLTGPLLWHHVKDVHSEQDHKEMTDYAKKVGQHDPDIGVIPPGWKRVKNSGTSDGVKKGWEKRRGKEFHHPGTGKMYHFNEETGLWHDRKGEPTRMSGIISHLEKQAKNVGRGSDSVRWAREFLRKSRAQPGKPKVDSTKWAREALVALKAHKPVTNDHRGDEALEAGIRVELEHGPDRALAEKIARDHLREDPEYYAKLKRCGVK